MSAAGTTGSREHHPRIPDHRWIFPGAPIRVLDGDTVDLELDLGFGMRLAQTPDKRNRFRLIGVDCPETNRVETRAAGLAAKAYTEGWLARASAYDRWYLLVEVVAFDNFGRILATIWRRGDGACLNADLLAAGHAVEDIRP